MTFNPLESLKRVRASKQRLEHSLSEVNSVIVKFEKEGKTDKSESYKQIREEIIEVIDQISEYISDLESDIIKDKKKRG
jgi:hypothetical protein